MEKITSILFSCLFLTSCATQITNADIEKARSWKMANQVTSRKVDMAAICHFWDTKLFSPDEKESCEMGSLYYVDLKNRIIFDGGKKGASQIKEKPAYRKNSISTLFSTLLESGGFNQLDLMRSNLVEERSDSLPTEKKLNSTNKNVLTNHTKENAKKEEKNLNQSTLEQERKIYVSDLEKKYKSALKFSSREAEHIVNSYSIDCNTNDKRYVRLKIILYATVAAIEKIGAKSEYLIKSNGKDIRIYEIVYGKDGRKLTEPSLKFEITQWGELIPFGIRKEAIKNTCFGSYGLIWETPPVKKQ